MPDRAASWLRVYGRNIEEEIAKAWDAIKPHYLQLHAYVRRLLRDKYGPDIVSEKGPVPAHMFGDMSAKSWARIAINVGVPFPKSMKIDVTDELRRQNYTMQKIFDTAEDFFISLGFPKLSDAVRRYSILEKINDNRTMTCHASTLDFYDSSDARLLMCGVVNQKDLIIVHHEMGHLMYFMAYKNLSLVNREGANPGFHEAIGDTIALSTMTPKHLTRINLLRTEEKDYQSNINELFQQALSKVAFLPYAYLIDSYRWSIFRGKIKKEVYNCEYWRLRDKLQGLKPPVKRTEEDFDAGAKYHVAVDSPYIRYFMAYIYQFQFHQALCTAAGQFDPANPDSKPLHECDIYGSKEAGSLLRKMMKLGSSKPWPDAMEVITGQRKMDVLPMLTYFKPLFKWLGEENKKSAEYIGWISEAEKCNVGS